MNYWLWLASIEMLGSIRTKKLLSFFNEPENIYNASKKDIMLINGIGEKVCEKIIESKMDVNKIKILEEVMNINDIKLLKYIDSDYPDNLKKIYDPPMILFYKGNINLLKNKSIAVIGSRKPTEYGIKIATQIGKDISNKGINVVSGLATGIDAYAHFGSLLANGNTIAILGNGIDQIYPKENEALYKNIAKKGLILSEYIIGTKPSPMNFPARNRIISGISDDIIVVEAASKSGTIITVDYALDQGKTVYAVPRTNKFST